jgi:hypothetical protein
MIFFVSSTIGDLFLFGISPELFSVQQIGYMLNDFPFIVLDIITGEGMQMANEEIDLKSGFQKSV